LKIGISILFNFSAIISNHDLLFPDTPSENASFLRYKISVGKKSIKESLNIFFSISPELGFL
jgi:hypothetical protein